jgi:hypothetical protein
MDSLFQRFSLESIKFNSFVLAAMIAIWLVVLACTVSSILAQPFSRGGKIFWCVFVIAVPLIGVLAFLPFSFSREELPDIFFGGKHKHAKRLQQTRRQLPPTSKK